MSSTTERRFSSARRASIAVALSLVVLVAGGCSRSAPRSESDIREQFALRLVEGAASGFMVIKAARYDAATGMLHDVRIEDGERIMHAARAEILVSVEMQTVSLRLHDVVGADETTGAFIALEGLTTEPTPVRVGRARD